MVLTFNKVVSVTAMYPTPPLSPPPNRNIQRIHLRFLLIIRCASIILWRAGSLIFSMLAERFYAQKLVLVSKFYLYSLLFCLFTSVIPIKHVYI